MKANILTSPAALGLLLAAICRVALAQPVPALINYQGQLTDATGASLPTADYTLTFSIHDAASGGNLVWGPQIFDGRSGAGYGPKLPVVQGYFNVMLGPVDTANRSLADAFTAATRYVEIRVGSNSPIAPRQQILSAPFALMAGNAAKLSGYDWGSLLSTNDPVNAVLQGSKIAEASLPGSKITDASLPASKIADNSLPGAKIAEASLPADKIIPRSITLNQIADLTITAGQIADNTLPGSKLVPATLTSNQLSVGAVATTNLADGSVTLPKLAARVVGTTVPAGGIALSASSGSFSWNGTTWADVPNLSVTIETTGRPVWVCLVASTAASGEAYIRTYRSAVDYNEALAHFALIRDEGTVTIQNLEVHHGSGSGKVIAVPPSSIAFIDFPSAGQHTYRLRVRNHYSGNVSVMVVHCRLLVYEL